MKRTANDVLNFFLWLKQRGPDLLPRGKQDDTYRRLKDDLDGLYLSEYNPEYRNTSAAGKPPAPWERAILEPRRVGPGNFTPSLSQNRT